LKIEEVVNWEWREIFWVYWFYFAMIIGLICATGFLLFSKVCFNTDPATAYGPEEIRILCWLLLLFVGSNISTAIVVWTFTEMMTKSMSKKAMIPACVGIFVFLLLFAGASIRFRGEIHDFFEKIAANEDRTATNESCNLLP
jgi:hypothetical protein